jgi:riboflavin kinase / FMN adenylyltransferase
MDWRSPLTMTAKTFRVYRRLDEIGPEARDCAVSIGNFDGVHAGHRRIFRRVVELGHERGWIPSVLTFDPHPTTVVAPARAPKLLSTTGERLEYMRQEGIEQVFVLPFDRTFSEQSPEEFVKRVLVDRIGAKAVLVGDNFRFGKAQAGDVAMLRALGDRFGFCTEITAGVKLRGRPVSSSAVRQLLRKGDVSLAARFLERPYRLEGDIVHGQGIGSKQTVPTLNLRTEAEVIPATGVYITRTSDIDSTRVWDSITNIGYRPTFEGQGLTIETFLLSPFDGATPNRIRLEFLRRVREERKFESPEALRTQIMFDVGRARAYFRRLDRAGLGTPRRSV